MPFANDTKPAGLRTVAAPEVGYDPPFWHTEWFPTMMIIVLVLAILIGLWGLKYLRQPNGKNHLLDRDAP